MLYLRVGERNRHEIAAAGARPFKPYANRPASVRYFAVPLQILDSPMDLTRWAQGALASARESADPKPRGLRGPRTPREPRVNRRGRR